MIDQLFIKYTLIHARAECIRTQNWRIAHSPMARFCAICLVGTKDALYLVTFGISLLEQEYIIFPFSHKSPVTKASDRMENLCYYGDANCIVISDAAINDIQIAA